MSTLAQRLGTTTHLSALLRKARGLGLADPEALERLAAARGCRYYAGDLDGPASLVGQDQFSDEELAVALLHPGLPYEPLRIRMGAAMVAAPGVKVPMLARLALMERAEAVLREIASAGQTFEPGNPFWGISSLLPCRTPCPPGVLPHPTRYVAMTGFTQRGREQVAVWVRPQKPNAHG